MSNTEPDAGGTQNFFRGMFQRNTQINAMAGSEIKIAGLEDATRQMADLNSELKGLVTSLTGLTQQQASLTSGISQTMKTIASNAQQTAGAVEGVTGSIGRFRSGAMSIASIFGSAVNSNFVKDLAMFPLRYITGATEQARNIGMGVSTTLGSQMYATGQTQGEMMQMLSRFPGGVRGGVEDIIGLQDIMRRSGAMLDLRNLGGQQNPRAVGMLRGVAEMQAMTPGTPVAQLATTLGGYAGNVGAQQQSAYLTGGAFAMIGAGGRQKSVSEWAEGILRWLEGQRPGDNRGKGFTYGELLAQYFPGSNIDAWLSQQSVPEGMKEYWWNYALAKSRMTGTTDQNLMGGTGAPGVPAAPFRVTPMTTGGNQAQGRLEAASAQARGQFRLGGALTGMFANKETANTWFNEIIAQVMAEVIPHQIAGGSLQAMGVMPDPIQELLMTFLERSGTLGAALGGYIGYGTQGLSGLNAGVFQSLFAGGLPQNAFDPGFLNAYAGNPNVSGASDMATALQNLGVNVDDLPDWLTGGGDVGDAWTSRGTSSTAGLHPTVRRGIERMMGDNPNIRVTSGLRDTVQQRRLRAAGNSNVSGKPSAHTRGLAADLGPRSEYGWITANAHRYGLRSGMSHGEPWHVGLPGIGDIGGHGDIGDTFPPNPDPNDVYTDSSGRQWKWNGPMGMWIPHTVTGQTPVPAPSGTVPPVTGPLPPASQPYNPLPTNANPPATTTTTGSSALGLGGLFDMFHTGVTKAQAIETIGSLVPTLLNVFLGTFGVGTQQPNLASIAYDPGLYAALRKAAGGTQGLISIGGTYQNVWPSALGGTAPGESGSSGGGGGGPPQTPDATGAIPLPEGDGVRGSTKSGIRAATALFNAGWKKRSDLETITAISWRESKWYEGAKNENTSDRGLMQINMSAHRDTLKELGYGESDLLQIQKNANVAYKLWSEGGGNYASFKQLWGFSENSPYSEPIPNRPGWDRNGDPLGRTQGSGAVGIVASANLPTTGDVDTAAYSMDPTTYAPALPVASSKGQVIVFNNTFNIGSGGDRGGIDVRRTVSMMAEQLEGEMNKRLARRN